MNNEQENHEKLKKQNAEKQLKKEKKVAMKRKKSMKKNLHEEPLKPFLKKVPSAVENLIGEGFVIYPVEGDGACGLRSVAAWIYQDPSLGPYLGRNVNTHFVKNWNHWRNYFSLPFSREVGIGKHVTCENEEQLLDFFLNSKEGACMW